MNQLEIFPGIKLIGKMLYLEKHDTLIFSDLQIGYEQQLLSKGVLIPKFQLYDMRRDIIRSFSGKKFSKIVINGDFKHEFGTISEQEWREALHLIDLILEHCDEFIFIRGNHDTMLSPIANKRKVKIVDSLILDEFFIVHGDKIVEIPKQTKTLIIGHEHPALGLRKGSRVERYKCFLKGKYKRFDLIVLPSFNPLLAGTDVLSEKLLSPFLEKSISDFEVFVVEEQVFYFGKIKDIVKKFRDV